jgi:predicted DNA-binding transcriptional regulator AlpA
VNAVEELEVMSEQTLEKILKLRPGALRRMRREGRGPTYCRVGRLIRYRRSAVEAWLKATEGK